MHRIPFLLSLLALAAAPRLLEAQGSITGTVTDSAAGTPLTGVSVSVVGTALTGRTDAAGRYVVGSVPPGTQRLRVRRLGYAPADKSVAVREGEQAVADFRLRTSAVELQEVVAVGYGEQTKATLTGSVSAVQGRELKTVPTVNLSNTVAGKLPGVVTVNRSGEPGYDDATIRVRGDHTLNDNSALIVIDGVPDRVGGLARLNPDDIESISVLKDATAAIYGSRAANGVILITTKRGSGSKPELTASFDMGVNHPTRLPRWRTRRPT